MTAEYFVKCGCHRSIPVDLFQAGTSVTCPACSATVSIPNTNTLKLDAGDKYPLLTNLEKIRRTLEEREPPFDGTCHHCGKARADVEVPIVFQTLVERVIADDGGVRLTPTGVNLVVGAAHETWQTTTFPLQLCHPCHKKFQAARSIHRFKGLLKQALLVGILIAFLVTAYFSLELVAALSGLLSIVGLIAWAMGQRGDNKLDKSLQSWLEKIRWIPEAIADAAESRIAIKK